MSEIVDFAVGANQGPLRRAAIEPGMSRPAALLRLVDERRERHRSLALKAEPQQERLEAKHLLAQMGVPGR